MNGEESARTSDVAPAAGAPRVGFRLQRLEVYNWGTFHHHLWSLRPGGDTSLLTGDIGSGKSTLVDAMTTLLVPPQKLAYNKAAGAEARERTLRSYVLGQYKTERGEAGLSARPVMLRDHNSYSVILASFFNEGFQKWVTLAQVFWLKDADGPPARLFVVADADLSIAKDFAGFGTDISQLRKRLRDTASVELSDTFPPYGAALRRRFGIENEQALELFHQTVSMKSVGNLTDFVREHMLEAFPVEPRIDALVRHFDDLHRAHEAVLRAKMQIERLIPIAQDCARHAEACAESDLFKVSRDMLRPWFAMKKGELLRKRAANLGLEITKLAARIESLSEDRRGAWAERDDFKRTIAENGGDRIERIKADIAQKQTEKEERSRRAEQYDQLARSIGLPPANDADTFATNASQVRTEIATAESRQAELQNAYTEVAVDFRRLKSEHDEIVAEVSSLRQRRSNLPARILAVRASLCEATGVAEEELPFAGELLQLREDERDWEGAAERVLHNFALSMLIPDAKYASVSQWVDRTHLGDRLVYFRVRDRGVASLATLHAESLVRKVSVKPDSAFYPWLESELSRRFNYACCDTMDQFRREQLALTRAGQVKGGGERHEKDDRHRIDDRSRYVLGWSNEAKIAALDTQAKALEARMQAIAAKLGDIQTEQTGVSERLSKVQKLSVFANFRELSWRPLAVEIDRLEKERRELEAESNALRVLQEKLAEVEQRIERVDQTLDEAKKDLAQTNLKADQTEAQLIDCDKAVAVVPEKSRGEHFPRLDALRHEALGEHFLTVESCDNREKDMREWVQSRLDAIGQRISRLTEKIVKAMQAYRNDYPLETQEADAAVDAAPEYRAMLKRLQADDLPRFEGRFKELLNENTIREVANFQSQLARERQTIRERIELINRSLRDIDYNPGRYVVLEDAPAVDIDIRDFQQELRACTEGALTGSDDEAYSEAKFLQVKSIIERFRGREGTTELDQRWTRKVTDVRNWFTFAASERWREDDREHEHYADSGGKSGGQKEKLAYTVLAASLAYQFGLEWGATRSRSFRFVVIDEAFGRGSDESARYGLELFRRMNLQLLVVTPLQKIHIIEPFVASVGFVHNEDGRLSTLRNLTIEEYRAERAARSA